MGRALLVQLSDRIVDLGHRQDRPSDRVLPGSHSGPG